jgi:hypothetical protein
MARKIKETPILLGKNARAFDKAISANEKKKVSSTEYKRAKANFARIKIS